MNFGVLGFLEAGYDSVRAIYDTYAYGLPVTQKRIEAKQDAKDSDKTLQWVGIALAAVIIYRVAR